MRSNAIVKTGWVRRQQKIVVVLLLCLVVLAAVFWVSQDSRKHTLSAGGRNYTLELAATPEQQEKGLSGRNSIAATRGMLFTFQSESRQCFWMKGMKFPLDIIWTNASRKVVHIERDISPGTYPKTFCPADPAVFVIELNAGEAANAGIHKGQILKF